MVPGTDDRHILICGNEPSKPSRCYRQDILSGQPEPITPEGVVNAFVTADGRVLRARGMDKSWLVLPVAGGPSRPAAGLTVGDRGIDWARDGRSVFVRVLTGDVTPESNEWTCRPELGSSSARLCRPIALACSASEI